MVKNLVIAEFGNALVRLLRRELCPDTIQNPDAIGLCSPSERGDYMVGVYLYDIMKNEEIRTAAIPGKNPNQMEYPPMYVSLFYMITVYSVSDIKFRAEEEQRILGRIIQVFFDHPCFEPDSMDTLAAYQQDAIVMKMVPLEFEDKTKIYSTPGTGYQLSLFYEAVPVRIDSLKKNTIQRVLDVDFKIREQNS